MPTYILAYMKAQNDFCFHLVLFYNEIIKVKKLAVMKFLIFEIHFENTKKMQHFC